MRIVGGRLSGRRFESSPRSDARPTSDRVREALGSALEARDAFDGARVLDLFAGTGALSFEALSRGARGALLVDRDARALHTIVRNARSLEIDAQVRTLKLDLIKSPFAAAARIPKVEGRFSLVFADAPYASVESVGPLLAALAEAKAFAPGAWIVVEHPAAHRWQWSKGLASDADYRYGHTRISFGVYEEKATT